MLLLSWLSNRHLDNPLAANPRAAEPVPASSAVLKCPLLARGKGRVPSALAHCSNRCRAMRLEVVFTLFKPEEVGKTGRHLCWQFQLSDDIVCIVILLLSLWTSFYECTGMASHCHHILSHSNHKSITMPSDFGSGRDSPAHIIGLPFGS